MSDVKPLTWREMLRVNMHRLVGDLSSSLSNTSPMPTRFFIGIATTLAAIGLWFAGEEWPHILVFEAMRATAPRWMWAAGFTLISLAQWWRLLDSTSRVITGLAINSAVAAMWILLTIELAISGQVCIAAAPFTVALQAAWVAARTGVTNLDRSRA